MIEKTNNNMSRPSNRPSIQAVLDHLSTVYPSSLHTAVQYVQDVKSVATTSLSPAQLAIFTANHNHGPPPLIAQSATKVDITNITNCTFVGINILLGTPQGLHRATIENCILDNSVEIRDTVLVRKVFMGVESKIIGCGIVTGPEPGTTTTFGNGTVRVSPGVETAGRATLCMVELDFESAARVAYDRSNIAGQAAFEKEIKRLAQKSSCDMTILCPHSICLVANLVENTFLGEYAQISHGARTSRATISAKCNITSGSDVRHSLLQESCVVELQSVVRDSLVCRDSHVEIHGKVLSSILGPASTVAEGEVTSSLMGPLVGFHHQSLLIASFWPAGRGNIGYGANVGSNHTSRLSDQSLWPGEGVFFGLGSSSKFPLNLSEAPYTIVATGVVWGPGRLNLPFSLVTEGGRVAPGWGIVSNTYQLERAFIKSKARAPTGYASQPIRAPIMNLVWLALRRLRALKISEDAGKLTEQDGLYLAGGYTTGKDVTKGLRAYEFVLELYALRAAYEVFGGNFGLAIAGADNCSEATAGRVLGAFDPADTGLDVGNVEELKQHACLVLHETVLRDKKWTPQELLQKYMRHEMKWADLVLESKKRDHDRGASVFPAGKYDEAVVELNKDPVVISARERAAKIASIGKM